jgi:hypothetical protein
LIGKKIKVMSKKNTIKQMEVDGTLYQKTNEDFNKEKPSIQDPLQTKNNPMQEEKKIKSFKQENKNRLW